MNLINYKNARLLLVVAHQDDESLYFGGLLSSLIFSQIKIICITAPAPNRPDTNTRIDSFIKVCNILKCKYELYNVDDCGPSADIVTICNNGTLDNIKNIVNNEIQNFKPTMLITHSPFGEPNPVYSNGHSMHRIISKAVQDTNFESILFTGIGWSKDIEFNYDISKKKQLIDCYLPNWSPEGAGYSFVYEPEYYSFKK